MSNYTKSTDFASKDALLSGNPAKVIKGTEIDTEFNSIATAMSTKADLSSPTFIGTPAAPTAAGGTNTTQIATTAFVQAEIASDLTTERSASATLTNKTINLANNTLTGTTAEFNTALSDGNFATIAGTETLTNKTLTSPTINSPTLTTPAVDVINEATSGAGVTVDGVLIKDSAISGQYTPLFRDTVKNYTSPGTDTTIDFTSIPSWVRRINILFYRLSHDSNGGGSRMTIRIGDATSFEITGYESACGNDAGDTARTDGFVLTDTDASGDSLSGIMTLSNVSGNLWVSSFSGRAGPDRAIFGGGSKTLTGTLTRVRITTESGTPRFDAGSVNIMYE